MRIVALWCALAGAAEAAELVVDTTGEGEKRLLKYEVADGAKEKMHLVFDMTMSVDAAGTQRGGTAPTLDTWAEMSIDRQDDGNFLVTFVYKKVKVKGGSGDLAAKEVKEGLMKLKGLHGTYTVTPFGEVISTDIQMPEEMTTPGSKGGMPFDMKEIGARLPSEPVGVGAQWTVTSSVGTELGLSFNQVSTYTVEAIQGDKVTLRTSVAQSAPPGPIDPSASGVEGLPSGAIELTHLDSTGSGRSVVVLDHLVPVEATIKVDMDMGMSMQMMGMAMTFVQKLSTTMQVSGK